MNDLVKQMTAEAHGFVQPGSLGKIYQEAALAANPAYKLGPKDAEALTAISEEATRGLVASGTFASHDTRRFLGDIGDKQKRVDDRSRPGFIGRKEIGSKQTTVQFAKQNMVKGKIYADGQRHNLASYSELVMRAAAQRAHNVAVANASGAQWFDIIDGPDCGWSSHDDRERADGSLRSLEEVLAYPIAHPNCQRRIEPRYDLGTAPDGPGRGSRAASALKAGLASQAASLATDLAVEGVKALATNQAVQSKVAAVAARAVPGAWAHRIENFMKMQKATVPEGTVDLNAFRLSKEAAEQAIADAQYDVAEGTKGRQRLRQFLNVEAEEIQLPKAVGDRFDQYTEYYDRTVRAKMSLREAIDLGRIEDFALQYLDTDMATLEEAIYTRAGEHFGSIGNRVARFTFPQVGSGEKFTAGRFTFQPNDLVQATVTKTQRGIVNRLGLNPHGLFRAGISRDPATGLWTPNFRLVPKGPIRISAKVNRSKGRKLIIENLGPGKGGRLGVNVVQEGRFQEVVKLTTDELFQLNGLEVGDTTKLGDYLYEKIGPDEVLQGRGRLTSVSWEAKLITKTPVNFSARFNFNLRKLGIHNWEDIRALSIEDFRKLGLSDMKFVSAAAELRAGGMGPLQLAKTFRITAEQAQELWELTSQYVEEQLANPDISVAKILQAIQDQTADVVARRRRAKFVGIYGEDEWIAKEVRESLADLSDRIDNNDWLKFEAKAEYVEREVVNLLTGEVGEVVRVGPSYVTVEYEGEIIKYQWETVNERVKILKELEEE